MNDLKKKKEEFLKAYRNGEKKEHLIKIFDKEGVDIMKPKDEGEEFIKDFILYLNCFFQDALKLDTVSLLFGTGSSIPLGAKSILKIPEEVKNEIKSADLLETHNKLYSEGQNLESYLSSLLNLPKTYDKFGEKIFQQFEKENPLSIDKIVALSSKIKTSLAQLCNVPNEERACEEFKKEPLKVHREFIKKILARPVNLKRVNIFTLNYDCSFETAMDELGVMYIDGFIGGTKKFFKPEVYNYDLYFPATTTEGKVHRLDKVVHLYKLHGSLNWFESEQTPQNIYGIIQKQIENISDLDDKALIIYPQSMKEEETIGFPYSEMFRRFSSIVQQPQNALIVYGYGFGDKHVNRVLYNALSISTFQLIIVSWSWTDELRDFYEKVKDDPRVSFFIGNYLGDWYNFVFNILPDIKEMDVDIKVLETMKKLKGKVKDTQDGN